MVFSQADYIRVDTGKYSQLSLENPHQIKVLIDAGHNQSEVARTIGVHRSTICREIRRNGAKYLQAREPKTVVFVEEHTDRSAACKREYEIKQYSKQGKESLITESR